MITKTNTIYLILSNCLHNTVYKNALHPVEWAHTYEDAERLMHTYDELRKPGESILCVLTNEEHISYPLFTEAPGQIVLASEPEDETEYEGVDYKVLDTEQAIHNIYELNELYLAETGYKSRILDHCYQMLCRSHDLAHT